VNTVIDSSVLVGILSDTDAHHAAALRWLGELQRDRDDILRPASAFAEVLLGAYRRGHSDTYRAELLVARGLVAIVSSDAEIAREAACLRAADLALGLPDALVIATGRSLKADSIATADRRWARYDERILVIK
jgi:predicted nucleic acid-binding protein